jgi:ubiquinone/menaquinone biosynthesis C-methylase UbiE
MDYYTADDLQAVIDQEIIRVYGPEAAVPRKSSESAAPPKVSAARQPDLTAESFDAIARSLFAPVYPGLAKQIIEDYRITTGRCLDVGCGPAFLSIALARRSQLCFDVLDIDPKALHLAKQNVHTAGMTSRFTFHLGDVHHLKFPADTFNLIVSRCSLLCWKNKVRAFAEVYRVLRPGGVGFIGMGSGRYLSDRERERILRVLDDLRAMGGADEAWLKDLPSTNYLRYIAMKAGIPDSRVLRYPDGVWVEMHKSMSQAEIDRLRRRHAKPRG